MSNYGGQPVSMICCAVFQAEVKALLKTDWPHLAIRFVDSMLHMKPDKLATRLESLVEEELKKGHKVLLIYGDCCSRMGALEAIPGVVRTSGNNCCQMLLGVERYRRLSSEGAFFLFPEWTRRWRHIFNVELGLSHDNTVSLMGEMHKKLVYLDTGVVPIPEAELKECSRYCELPWEVLKVPLEPLRAAIQGGLLKLEGTRETR